MSVRDFGLVTLPNCLCGCDETIQSCFASEINVSLQMRYYSELVSFWTVF